MMQGKIVFTKIFMKLEITAFHYNMHTNIQDVCTIILPAIDVSGSRLEASLDNDLV